MSYIIESGESSEGIILENDFMTVADGGTATETTVENGGSISVLPGGTANITMVEVGGSMFVSNGGTAVEIMENGGYVEFEDGAEITFTQNTIPWLEITSTSATVHSDTTASNVSLSESGRMDVFSGGSVNTVAAFDGGILHISSGGTAEFVSVENGGSLFVSGGGTATEITENGGWVEFEEDTEIAFVPNLISDPEFSATSVTVHSGTTANDIMLYKSGRMDVFSSGIVNGGVIFDGGTLRISGGTVNNPTIDIGGSILVSSGGIVNEVLIYENGSLDVLSDGTANDVSVECDGQLRVSSGGTVNGGMIYAGGSLDVFSEGTANDITIEYYGQLRVSSGGVANGAAIDADGILHVSSGGVANGAMVGVGGILDVLPGGTATDVSAERGALLHLSIAPDTWIAGTSDGSAFEFKGGTLSDWTIWNCLSLFVHQGGIADHVTADEGGELVVCSGGVANNAAVNVEGSLSVSSGGTADCIAVSPGGSLEVLPGGTATNISAEAGAYLYFSIAPDTWIAGTSGGSAFEFEGGTLSDWTIWDGMTIVINSGGMADHVTVRDNRLLMVVSGGIADNTENNGGVVFVESGGIANNTAVSADGSLIICSGGIANNTAVNAGGNLRISSGGTANDITLLSNGRMSIEGGTANDMRLLNRGWIDVRRDGTANDITVGSGGSLNVIFGGTVYGVALKGGSMFVSAGGTANDTTISSGGSLHISGSGMANGVAISSGGSLFVSSGGLANGVAVESDGRLRVSSGGVVKGAVVSAGGSLYVTMYGAAIGVVEAGGYVDAGANNVAFVSNTFSGLVLDGRSATVHSGTTAADVTLKAGGLLHVYSGGSVANVVWSPCEGILEQEEGAYVTYAAGQQYSGVYYGEDGYLLSSAMTMEGVTVQNAGMLYVMSEGFAGTVSVEEDGRMFVSAGGSAEDVAVKAYASMHIASGGSANGVTVGAEGFLKVSSGGTAAGIEAEAGAYLNLAVAPDTYIEGTSGGVAFEIKDARVSDCTVGQGGRLTVFSGGAVETIFVDELAGLTVSSGGVANGVSVNGGEIHVDSGGTATNLDFDTEFGGSLILTVTPDTYVAGTSGGSAFEIRDGLVSGLRIRDSVTVCSGGTASSDTLHKGTLRLSGGMADNIMVAPYGSMYVFSGGTANSTVIDSRGSMYVSGGVADGITVNSGYVQAVSGGAATGVQVTNGTLDVFSGGVADDILLYRRGYMFVGAGGTASGTVAVTESSYIYIDSGGTASDTVIAASTSMSVVSGGTAADTVIAANGRLTISGGKLTGKVINLGGPIRIDKSCSYSVNFDLTGILPGAAARINDAAIMSGNADFSITVNADQAEGVYSLAENVNAFDRTLSIEDTSGTDLGTISVGGTVMVAGTAYALDLSNGVLTLKIGENETPSPYTSDGLVVSKTTAVRDGMVFHDTMIGSGNRLNVSSGGMADRTLINTNGSMFISSGGTANDITLLSNGRMTIEGGTANDMRLLNRGWIDVRRGGTANDITVGSGGSLNVISSGTADRVTVNSGGSMFVSGGGTANDITLLSNGRMTIEGGTANDATIDSGGSMRISGSGMASGVVIGSGGRMSVEQSATANDVMIGSGGSLDVRNAMLNNAFVSAGGSMRVIGDSARATNIIEAGGYVDAGANNVAFVSNTFSGLVLDGRSATVHSGTTAADVTLKAGGLLHVYSGGSVANVVWSPCEGILEQEEGAYVTYAAGQQYSGVYYGEDGYLLSSAMTMEGVTVQNAGMLYVMSEGFAGTVSVEEDGRMFVSAGGSAEDVAVKAYASMHIASGGSANGVTVGAEGFLKVSSGGTAAGIEAEAGTCLNFAVAPDTWIAGTSGGSAFEIVDGRVSDYTVGPEGRLTVFSGGAVETISVDEWAELTVSSGGTANGVTMNGGEIHVDSGGTATNLDFDTELGGSLNLTVTPDTYVAGTSGGSAFEIRDGLISGFRIWDSVTVCSGGTVKDTEVAYGSMFLSGGMADNIMIAPNGGMYVFSGTVNSAVIDSRGFMYVSGGTVEDIRISPSGYLQVVSGGVANGILLDKQARMDVVSGGTANRVRYNSGFISVASGGVVNSATITSSGSIAVLEGGTANDVVAFQSRSLIYVSSGGVANNAVIYSGGDMIVFSGGTANNTAIYGLMTISGGTADGLVHYGGTVRVTSGGKLTGKLICLNGSISVQAGATVDFDLTRTAPGADALISDFSRISGDFGCTITADAGQAEGTYSLAKGAAEFDRTITVVNTAGTALGTISVGETITVSDTAYALGLRDGVLTLKVGENETPSPYTSDGLVISGMATVGSGELYHDTFLYGEMFDVASGGTATGTTVARGSMHISSGGTADNTLMNGVMTVASGGTATGTTVNGSMHISSGGTATEIVENGGCVTFEEGAVVTFAPHVVYLDLVSSRVCTVHSGTTVSSGVVYSRGELRICSGGMGKTVTVNERGSISVFSGGTASGLLVDKLGLVVVSSGGSADGVVVSSGGSMVLSGGTADHASIFKGSMVVSSGGTASDIVISEGGRMILSDGTVNGTMVSSGGSMVLSGGTASDTTVKTGGNMVVYSGGITGKMMLEAGAVVSVNEGGIIDFDLTRTEAGTEALINDLSVIQGTPTYTLMVNGTSESGVYSLAGGAAGFDTTITVKNTLGRTLGTLAVGEKVYIGKDDYTLTLTDDVLTVAINSPTVTKENGDVLIENAMPKARYMYGCGATTTAMILGYYDLYGYRGMDFSALIEGDVELNPRGSADVKYKMNDFESNLGKATATMDYVQRFYSKDSLDLINTGKDTETTPSEELEYSFVNGGEGPEIRTDIWNCIADYLGTGQFWRGNDNLDTTCHPGIMLERYLLMDNTITITDEETGTQRDISAGYNDLQYGVYLYVRSRGYSLDMKLCKAHTVDTVGGSFTFEDYMKEIDEGRPVYVIIEGHVMAGYGYNAETREIIFDSCYEADERMAWGGTYNFAKKDRTLLAVVTIGMMAADNDTDLAISPFDEESGVTEKLIVATAEDKLVSEDYCFVGSPLYLSFAVSNLGTAASPSFDTSIYFDDELTENIPSMTLDAGTITRLRNVPLVTGFGAGLHTITVRIDPGNEFPETSGLNNAEEVHLMVLKEGTNVVEGTKTVDSGEISKDDYVMNGAGIQVLDGGTAEGTLIQGKVTSQSFDGEVLFTPGLVNVSKGGLVRDAAVYEYGQLQLSGTAENTSVLENGNMEIFFGGIASGIFVDDKGILTVEAGGTVTGQVQLEDDANVLFEEGAILNFDLTGTTAGAEALVNDLSIIQGTPSFTLTVAGTEAEGAYSLADGAAGFAGTITVKNIGGTDLGTLAVGETLAVGRMDYTLNLTDDVLSVLADTRETYDFRINGEVLSVRKAFADGAVFDTVTLTTEQLNSFEWLNAEEGVSITVNGIALENGRCDFALTGINKDTTIEVELTQGESSREFFINTMNSHLPEIRAEIQEGSLGANTPGDFFLSFINTRSIVKTDNAGNILYYRNEDSPDTQYGLWDFKTHQIDGRTYYSYHSTESHPESIVFTGHNPGERVIMDENYNEIARIRAIATEKNGGDTTLDGHEFLMLGEDHYIVMSYLQVEADNIPDVNIYTGELIEHADKAILVATYIQEIDHGEVVFDWLSTEHPELYSMTVTDETEGAADFTNTDPEVYVDYVHLNAIVIDDDGNLVVSCRHLNSMIKIDRNGGTGNLMWVLSGVGDEFGLTEDRKTSGQHYLHYLGNGFFSAFNNNNDKGPTDLVLYHLNVDETALVENDGFRCWVVPGTTELEPGLPCLPHDTYACGAFQLLGEYGVAGWGWNISGDELVTEFKLDDPSEITFQLRSGYSKEGAYATYRVVKCLSSAPELAFTQQAASWSEIEHSSGYVLSVAHQGADDALSVGYSGSACDIFNLPNGEYVAKVTENDFGVSSAESSLKVEDNLSAVTVVSTENGIDDLFFAKAAGTWEPGYFAKHVGSVNDWTGTNDLISPYGKNRLADLFFGSDDANILCLTDDENGDGIFVDDEFTDLPDGVVGQQSRIAKIDEIRAGAGDDIIDMTSQRYEYIGDGLTVRGGDGGDTIWANKGNNFLFGDAGNDRVVGASGNDVIAGGIGNDRLHGGGGDDVFTFCDNWGADTVEQLEGGSVTLWFAHGSMDNWNADSLTYTDGENSVSVKGVASVSLKFGEDSPADAAQFATLSGMGAFADFTSRKVFEESKGVLAGR